MFRVVMEKHPTCGKLQRNACSALSNLSCPGLLTSYQREPRARKACRE